MLTTRKQRAIFASVTGALVFLMSIFILVWSSSNFLIALKITAMTAAIVGAVVLFILLFDKVIDWVFKGENK